MLDGATILAIPETEPERLFPRDVREANKLRKELVGQWHPDRNPDGGVVLAHVNRLYDLWEEKIAKGLYQEVGLYRFQTKRDSKTFALKYRKAHTFELGETLISEKLVTFRIDRKHEDHVLRGIRAIGSIKYPTPAMKRDLEKYFPKVEKVLETTDQYVIITQKTPDLILLKDLITHLGGKINPKHVAWILSSLLNLSCFLEINRRTHNGLTLDSVFASPKYHAVALLGGWWYSVEVGQRMLSLPPAVHAVTPRAILTSKAAAIRTDLESIRAIGRACLGDPSGTGLRSDKDVPAALANWLRLPAPDVALTDYENWQKVLKDSFGPRRFVELSVDPNAVYPGV